MDAELSALLAEVRADANRYNERFGRPKLTLIKGGGGGDSQEVTHSDKKCPPIAAAVNRHLITVTIL